MANTTPVKKAKELLTSTLEAIDGEIASLEQRLAELRAEKKQVAASLNPLQKEPSAPAKPATKKTDVIEVARSILSHVSPLSREELKKRVTGKVSESHSLSGFALRFNEALETDTFIEDHAGVRLRNSAPTERREP